MWFARCVAVSGCHFFEGPKMFHSCMRVALHIVVSECHFFEGHKMCHSCTWFVLCITLSGCQFSEGPKMFRSLMWVALYIAVSAYINIMILLLKFKDRRSGGTIFCSKAKEKNKEKKSPFTAQWHHLLHNGAICCSTAPYTAQRHHLLLNGTWKTNLK